MRSGLRRCILPPGPLMMVMLAGVMFLGGLLYYRAVKIQRFLEPALAISQPRSEFTDAINSLLKKEFGPAGIRGIRFAMGSIVVDTAVLFPRDGRPDASSSQVMKKLGRVLLSTLDNDYLRSHSDMVLVLARYPLGEDTRANGQMRLASEARAEKVLEALYNAEPLLQGRYAPYFASASMPAAPGTGEENRIEFRIVPSEQLHIEVLQRLRKYVN
ncbi:MAG: hypothetical protein M0Z60_11900 [Nitrospiraceae bacterium]|nr:hypothetical protein [Nitrospiraceae bacterium]